MEKRRCFSCHGLFFHRPQSPAQRYCSAPACKRERRRRWQKEKRRTDPDYKVNQKKAQDNWRQRNPDYWPKYRHKNRQMVQDNTNKNAAAPKTLGPVEGVKMDLLSTIFPFESGIYRLQMHSSKGAAKMDAWVVKITVLSKN